MAASLSTIIQKLDKPENDDLLGKEADGLHGVEQALLSNNVSVRLQFKLLI